MIPRTLHQVWLGGEIPAVFQRWTAKWRELNPGWVYCLWTEGNLPGDPPPDGCINLQQQSNWIRLQALWEHGGLYIDHDVEPLRPIEPLIGLHSAVASPTYVQLGKLFCCNGFLAAEKNHLWIGACIEAAKTMDPTIRRSFGSEMVTRELVKHGGVHVLDREDIMQRPFWRKLGRRPEARWYAVHHFANMDPGVKLL